MKISLNEIKSHSPCTNGWKTLLRSLGKSEADSVEIDIRYIIESNGIEDAIWCLRAVEKNEINNKIINDFKSLCIASLEKIKGKKWSCADAAYADAAYKQKREEQKQNLISLIKAAYHD